MGAERLCLCSGAVRVCHNRWRRITPCLVVLVVIATVQFFCIGTNNTVTQYVRDKLASLTHPPDGPKSNGPLRILLLSYARSGSSFVGDLLQSLPNSFYHFEPLHFLQNGIITDRFEEGSQLLYKLFTCNVSHVQNFLEWQKVHKSYMKLRRSTSYWNACSKNNSCFKADYMDAFCRNHSAIIMKTIRFTLDDAVKVLEQYPDLNLKIIYLIRDPRGTITSRMKKPIAAWCNKDPMCINPFKLCSLLAGDVNISCSLLSTRPNDFMFLRYEDLSLYPFETANQLVKFLDLPFLPWSMETFLMTHTTVSGKPPAVVNGVAHSYSTFRNSSRTALQWRQIMKFDKLKEIQKCCKQVLSAVGYHIFTSTAMLRSNLNLNVNLSNSLASTCSLKEVGVS